MSKRKLHLSRIPVEPEGLENLRAGVGGGYLFSFPFCLGHGDEQEEGRSNVRGSMLLFLYGRR